MIPYKTFNFGESHSFSIKSNQKRLFSQHIYTMYANVSETINN